MSWLFEVKRFASEKNGQIICRKFLGQWWIFVDSYDQSSPYIKKMWRSALKRIPPTTKVTNTLLLGLGGGSIVDDLATKYPKSRLTVIEYDPVMVEIARETQMFTTKPNIIIKDAVLAVPQLNDSFYLIVVDLYRGGKTSPSLEDSEFISLIEQKLSDTGTLLINVFENTELLNKFDQFFLRETSWVYSYNALAIYKKKSTEI